MQERWRQRPRKRQEHGSQHIQLVGGHALAAAASRSKTIEKDKTSDYTAWLALAASARVAGPAAPDAETTEYYSEYYSDECYSDEGEDEKGDGAGRWARGARPRRKAANT